MGLSRRSTSCGTRRSHARWDDEPYRRRGDGKAIERNDLDCVQTAMNPARALRFEDLALPAAKKKDLGVILMKVTGQERLVGPGPASRLAACSGTPSGCRSPRSSSACRSPSTSTRTSRLRGGSRPWPHGRSTRCERAWPRSRRRSQRSSAGTLMPRGRIPPGLKSRLHFHKNGGRRATGESECRDRNGLLRRNPAARRPSPAAPSGPPERELWQVWPVTSRSRNRAIQHAAGNQGRSRRLPSATAGARSGSPRFRPLRQ